MSVALPGCPLPPDRRQSALTARFLRPVEPALMEFFLAVRAETDRELGAPGRLEARNRLYPKGFCLEITMDVLDRLRRHVARPAHPAARALKAFLSAGGTGGIVWGVLRGQYFQNALQFGGLYVDVANDTVTVTKPKVEILPMERSGFEAVRGPEHFAEVSRTYWDLEIYANHALPALAPILPMIGVQEGARPALLSTNAYMLGLFRQDAFRKAQAWLESGPVPPAGVVEALRALCPDDVLADNPQPGRQPAVDACVAARAAGAATDEGWVQARLLAAQRIRS